ncbi:hypothetical protein Dimus_015714, partial [Dionaea muscipula]
PKPRPAYTTINVTAAPSPRTTKIITITLTLFAGHNSTISRHHLHLLLLVSATRSCFITYPSPSTLAIANHPQEEGADTTSRTCCFANHRRGRAKPPLPIAETRGSPTPVSPFTEEDRQPPARLPCSPTIAGLHPLLHRSSSSPTTAHTTS